jgi:hypothetical protein
MIRDRLPAPASSTLILVCGPKPFVDAMITLLIALGYTDKMIYKF